MSEEPKKDANILKVRDDRNYLELEWDQSANKFTINSKENFDWCSEEGCTKSDLRSRIEPWLTSLFQSEHLSLLVGSGLTTAVQFDACGSADNGMSKTSEFTVYSDEIEKVAVDSAKKSGRNIANIEDRIRVANEVLNGLKVLQYSDDVSDISTKLDTLRSDLENVIKNFTDNISEIEASIMSADPVCRETAINKLVLFLMSFASRTGTRDRLNIFTTNYDRLMVRMNYLNEKFRPKSDDPEYWNTWTESNRAVNWDEISKEWQDYSNEDGNYNLLGNNQENV